MQRLELVQFAQQPAANKRALCRQLQISPSTAYKWLERFAHEGLEGLSDRSRRPRHSPGQSAPEIEQLILQLHARFPCWGPRKLRQLFLTQGLAPGAPPPGLSTIARILKRRGCHVLGDCQRQKPFQRFVAPAPNHLWQMDFKGHFALSRGGRCFPLTILDDHSRFALALRACSGANRAQVPARPGASLCPLWLARAHPVR